MDDAIEDPFASHIDPKHKVKNGVVYLKHEPTIPWNEMEPVLGMRFEHPEQLKLALANYEVANGQAVRDGKCITGSQEVNIKAGKGTSKYLKGRSKSGKGRSKSRKGTRKNGEGSSKNGDVHSKADEGTQKASEGTSKAEPRDGVTINTRRRHNSSSDGIAYFKTVSARTDSNADLEDSFYDDVTAKTRHPFDVASCDGCAHWALENQLLSASLLICLGKCDCVERIRVVTVFILPYPDSG
ncbi:hypothetical protein Tco_1080896 [Tanacetum coccineum]|uniref:Uncharacterized protein n=1 Tax=Tanacetum coccineum TaxID=301880 RepID=A0ABQ5HX54_9ASTR